MANGPKQVQVIVENEFATSNKNSEELNITVFERTFRKLIHEKSEIGKIFPIYIKIDNIYRVLGIFTLNRQGSTSFFPEFPEGTFFDHITIGNTIDKNNAHLTQLIDGKRKKVSPLGIELLSNGVYHLITFIFQDFELLKLAPKEVIYPPIDVEQFESLKDALYTRNNYNGSGLLDAIGIEGSDGPIIVQIFVIPKGVDYRNLQVAKSPLGPISRYFQDEELINLKKHVIRLKHEFQDEYQFGLLAFRYPTKINSSAYIGYAIDKSNFYFNSMDKKLEASIVKNVLDSSKKIHKK